MRTLVARWTEAEARWCVEVMYKPLRVKLHPDKIGRCSRNAGLHINCKEACFRWDRFQQMYKNKCSSYQVIFGLLPLNVTLQQLTMERGGASSGDLKWRHTQWTTQLSVSFIPTTTQACVLWSIAGFGLNAALEGWIINAVEDKVKYLQANKLIHLFMATCVRIFIGIYYQKTE